MLWSIIITIADKAIGSTLIGGAMFARGKGQEHWEDIRKFQKQHIQRWHILQGETTKEQNTLPPSSNGQKTRRNTIALK